VEALQILSPKDPVIEAWKSNPAAQVAEQDRKIEDAQNRGEQQDRRYIRALRVIGDCYTMSEMGGTWIRRFQYQPIDQFGVAFARGEVSVTELTVSVQGGDIKGNATWDPSKMNRDGSFYDYVGKTAPFGNDIVLYQTFTATMINSAGFNPGVPTAVMVEYAGYKGGQFGTMGHWLTNGGVRTNDYWHHPERGRTVCADEPRIRR
jgi:hypothetical protein